MLFFRGLLGQVGPILISGGRAVSDCREAFVGTGFAIAVPERRQNLRDPLLGRGSQEGSAAIVRDLHTLARDPVAGVGKIQTRRSYAISRPDIFERFLTDGRAELDSNTAERAIRTRVRTRKNSLAGSNDVDLKSRTPPPSRTARRQWRGTGCFCTHPRSAAL